MHIIHDSLATNSTDTSFMLTYTGEHLHTENYRMHLTLTWAQFSVPKIYYWSNISVDHLSCIQWNASNRLV